jgi:hypothetical protein
VNIEHGCLDVIVPRQVPQRKGIRVLAAPLRKARRTWSPTFGWVGDLLSHFNNLAFKNPAARFLQPGHGCTDIPTIPR